jgi:hypothetical protein
MSRGPPGPPASGLIDGDGGRERRTDDGLEPPGAVSASRAAIEVGRREGDMPGLAERIRDAPTIGLTAIRASADRPLDLRSSKHIFY